MAQMKTPGVYIAEIPSFATSIAGVATAVPLFIGYTQLASQNGATLLLTPTPIASMANFEAVFGSAFQPAYELLAGPPLSATTPHLILRAGPAAYTLQQQSPAKFVLYQGMQLFFANGGTNCYVVSVGDYTAGGTQPNGGAVTPDALLKGLAAAGQQSGPTMLVIPDAVALPDIAAYATVAEAMLKQCSDLQDRVAILDVYGTGALSATPSAAEISATIAAFQNSVGSQYLDYAAAYFPFLNAALTQPTDFPEPTLVESITGLQALLASEPALLSPIQQWLAQQANILPPSGAIAGSFALNDAAAGVWNPPANLALVGVLGPTVPLNDQEQSLLGDTANGKSVNAIRSFPARGTIIWGARTLENGNADFRYVSVRRTAIYVEQSIKAALRAYVFEPNSAATWVTVTSSISTFLETLWRQGALMGSIPDQAFAVRCGLGTTMTTDDVLNGHMIVEVLIAVLRPAEFIVLTFSQQMQTA